ncbi:hypothetical protein NDU88_003988 [Pleurodeles waltl]|uniref:Uncharacterized protein n=1 Tax=Pleurodeles waltl TaxID=8319 RepID=A0AAV7LTF3_PLEWA|nr:hypothetical protein NDU88_003988 [Pleurodeles waltl]
MGTRRRAPTSVAMPGSKRRLRFTEHAAPIRWAARSSRRARNNLRSATKLLGLENLRSKNIEHVAFKSPDYGEINA